MLQSKEWLAVYASVLGGITAKKFQVAYTERVMGGDYLDNPSELDLTDYDFKLASDAASCAVRYARNNL